MTEGLNEKLATMRRQYSAERTLSEKSVLKEPIAQATKWLAEAAEKARENEEANAMVLSTVSEDGWPNSRIVLLKGLDNQQGFVFFTNYESGKGQDIKNNPKASLCFYWPHLQRTLRVKGKVQKIPDDMSDKYFYTRSLGSQLNAHASPQSQVIESKEELIEKAEKLKQRFAGPQEALTIPRPAHWGGLGLIPVSVEFWQGGEDRFHDRLLFTRKEDTKWPAGEEDWVMQRLAP